MSKSYKKNPYNSDNIRGMKKIANRKVRQNKFLYNKGRDYRKVFHSYEICDYKCRFPWKKAEINGWHKGYQEWSKYFRRK